MLSLLQYPLLLCNGRSMQYLEFRIRLENAPFSGNWVGTLHYVHLLSKTSFCAKHEMRSRQGTMKGRAVLLPPSPTRSTVDGMDSVLTAEWFTTQVYLSRRCTRRWK